MAVLLREAIIVDGDGIGIESWILEQTFPTESGPKRIMEEKERWQ